MIKRYTNNELDELATILKNDGVVSVPTDTVYGVCSRINSIEAFNNLVKVKNRDLNKSLPIMCANLEQIKEIAYVNPSALKIINKYMPGPLTIILKIKNLPDYVGKDDGTVAIRMATSKVLEELILKVGCPIFLSSANQSGMEVAKTLDDIEKNCPLLDGILEGDVSYGLASTIVKCVDEVEVLRVGPISEEEIFNVINGK